MSDSNFGAVTRFQGFVDLFDAAWEADCLSDDGTSGPRRRAARGSRPSAARRGQD